MPYCINNVKRTYTGNEPSPKGLGYCASGEKEGTIMKGKDGKMWIKKNGKWIHDIKEPNSQKINNCKNIVKYIKTKNFKYKNPYMYKENIFGKEINGKFYEWKSYNEFSEKSSKIKPGYKKDKIDQKYLNDYICGSKKTEKELDKKIHKGYKTYIIAVYSDGNWMPFLVAIKNKTAKIFVIGKDIAYYNSQLEDYDYNFTDLIMEYKFDEIFIPKGFTGNISSNNSQFKNNKVDKGNTILLKIKNKYICICKDIFEFTTNDDIINYYSPIDRFGDNYPVAIGKENVYFMLDKTYVPIKHFEGFKLTDFISAYGYYYGYKGDDPLDKYAKKIKKLKIIYNLHKYHQIK
jgi:hypothetical protein